MLDWIHEHDALLWWLAAGSVVMFIGTLIVVPILIVRIPDDYFADQQRHRTRFDDRHPLIRWTLVIGKNILGAVFVAAGLAMLALPGQGLLTLAIGVMLLDFPGKYRLERWLVSRGPMLRAINWMRLRAGRSTLCVQA